ncbi:uncharacterized protein LOC109946680 isoform X2 [Prunus persica]|uniref:uncharacterized protein LOC109946680 isoform X2 n=1 Tax=Prunus persica TaxID=3760 RepID=UPI0009ABA961|nr:uncharacterized protein LOC109946680 isoform X2 [Prunus persica]
MISLLPEFMDTCENKDIRVEEYLDFIVKKRSVASKEALGIRIHSMGMHISAIWEARNLEISTLKKSEKAFQPNSDKKDRKFPLLSAEKKELDKRFSTISQRVESFSPIHKDFCGKHIRFDPKTSSSEDEGRDDYLSEENDENNDHVTGSQVLDRMLQFNNTEAQKRQKIKSMFSLYPLIGLLNVVASYCGLRNFPMFGGQNNLCRQQCIVSELKLMVSFEPMDFSRYHKCNGKLTNWSRQRVKHFFCWMLEMPHIIIG